MPDRLYLSCWIEGFNEANMMRHFEKLLSLFPFSKLTKAAPVVRVYAVEQAEPPVIERTIPPGAEVYADFVKADCTIQVEAAWDLWKFDNDWGLKPSPVTISAYGPDFENEIGDHLRIEFGLDSQFLPQPDIEGSLRMVQSNIRSLLFLVSQVDQELDLERRQLWSESGANFAELVAEAVQQTSNLLN